MMRVLSGVQPTGNLHLGNYLGAIKNWVDMQNNPASISIDQLGAQAKGSGAYKNVREHPEAMHDNAGDSKGERYQHECLFCIVDLHAITVPQDPESLRKATRETAAAYIACGIDPAKSVIFHQSAVPEHSELAWLFSTITPMGWLNRMTQFKEKSAKYKDDSGLGLYAYPILMAADILLYHTDLVPVGEDQKQHLELTRDIAGAFNRRYNLEYFKLPEPMILGNATRVMSLRDGKKKMSKSEESDFSRINLTDDADTIAKKIKKATSDMITGISYDVEKRPEVSNLVNIFASATGQKREQIVARYADSGMAAFKGALAEAVIEHLSPIRAKLLELSSDTAYLDKILHDGAKKARSIASANIEEIKKIMGFLQA